jgi:hypothetical protein
LPRQNSNPHMINGVPLEGLGAASNFAGARKSIPFFASLNANDGGSSGFLCGGTILDETHILTAAHCVVNGGRLLPFVDVTLAPNIDSSRTFLFTARGRATVHPSYVDEEPEYDMAIVTIDKRIPFGDEMAPATLASKNPPVGTAALVMGHGVTERGSTSSLVRTATNIVMDCARSTAFSARKETVICMRGIDPTRQNVQAATCQGDSGGPAVINGAVVGVVSSGTDGCGQNGDVDNSNFCSVAAKRSWILQLVPNAKFDDGAAAPVPRIPSPSPSPSTSSQSPSQQGNGCYTLRSSDQFLDAVALRFGLTQEALEAANPRASWRVGETIVVPGGARVAPCSAPRPPMQQAPSVQQPTPTSQSAPQPGGSRRELVRQGDGWYSIARRTMPAPLTAAKVRQLQDSNPGITALVPGTYVVIPTTSSRVYARSRARLDQPPSLLSSSNARRLPRG